MERISSGDLMEIAKVFVALKCLSESKDLSFGERKLLDHAAQLIEAEFKTVGIEL